jgi:NTP pyrophosphatase (non-canonical NTP hydrolase)
MKKIQKLQDLIHEWADKTFGKDREPTAPLYHLKREVNELIEAIESEDEGKVHEEFSDCFILILNAASKYGLNVKTLYLNSLTKMDVNKIRRWGTPDKHGVVEHLKDRDDEDCETQEETKI